MRVAITGSSGFIGKLLVERHIKQGDYVHLLSRKKNKNIENNDKLFFFLGDLLEPDSLIEFVEGVDVLYHCAAEIKDESKMKLVNIEGTKNLINVASGNIKHWVQLSSTGVYGPLYKEEIDENQKYNPNNEYERTKLASDILLLQANENLSFTYTIIRPSNVFGFQMSNQSIFQLVKSVEKGFYFFIGSKGASANYIPVDNVIEGLYLAGTHPNAKNEIFIISSWCTIEEFITYISSALGVPITKKRVPVFFMKMFAKITVFIPNNPLTTSRVKALSNRVLYKTDKIENLLGYKSIKSIETTVADLVSSLKGSNNL